MSNFQSIQFDAQGNEVVPVDHSSGIQTKSESKAAKAEGPGYGAQIRDVNAENAASRVVTNEINGGEANRKLAAEAFEFQLAELVQTDTIIQHLEGAGRPVPQSIREKRSQLNVQTQITGAGLTEDVINEITERVRSQAL